ncbi:MAG: DUF1570 domain-containing protein [Planctomycetales bacterium]|nr:DUF1570 domain-containing protein [Planctomycetales bacterium]NIN07325.1 DUF1570 domain-containing protein [Planctomycetales bacterium]NIN76428.1 DUF1570 domain-containing protein [Planctomycetales bacterium]NIO45436.1 DUF1570 domain-containing protein [Planctomycetales bacterium]NIP03503.1 DUF1570 domain-containing protein [Planctomycetales bacterium]
MRIFLWILFASLLPSWDGLAEEDWQPAVGVDVREVARWPTDQVVLHDGRRLEGLIRQADSRRVELVEVGRKPGRPMYLLVRWIDREEIAQIQRLDTVERHELQRRIFAFRKRTKIAAALRQQIHLTVRSQDDVEHLHYEGPWFTLDSTADEPLTREVVVRVEQMMAGFRTFIRPQHEPPSPPRIVLLNTQQEYLAFQQRAALRIEHAAYFDVQKNEIIAGGELAALSQRLEEIRQHHRQLREKLEQRDEQLQTILTRLTHQLREAGHDEDVIRDLRKAARSEWKRKLREPKEAAIRLAERENEAIVQEKFRVLYHEAFHAYLENYVFDRTRYKVPAWLNEGLAQVFESGLLDAGLLRLDAPDPTRLASLQRELRGPQVLPLVELITAPAEEFLVQHGEQARRSNRLYLYSWGLAFYLIFEGRTLDSEALDRYLKIDSQIHDPVRRFEAMVDMPLDKFEAQWRQAMLQYRS